MYLKRKKRLFVFELLSKMYAEEENVSEMVEPEH